MQSLAIILYFAVGSMMLLPGEAVEQSSSSGQRAMFNIGSMLSPSNSPLHPLHFQDAWQASEPMPVDIYYKVPVYGEGDLLDALTKANDKAVLLAELKRQKQNELETKEYLRSVAERRIEGIRGRLQLAGGLRGSF